jgi:hypothetical protein
MGMDGGMSPSALRSRTCEGKCRWVRNRCNLWLPDALEGVRWPIADMFDIADREGGRRRFLPGLKAGVCTPRI